MKDLIELRKMSKQFFKIFPKEMFPEMEHKEGRPYAVLLVKISDIKFAIPFRTNIRHSYCYKFSSTGRNTKSVTGIDFTKAVVIDSDLLLGEKTNIDNKEFIELQNKSFFIVKKFKKYVDDYIKFKRFGGNPYVAKRYQYSTLKYFDKILLK